MATEYQSNKTHLMSDDIRELAQAFLQAKMRMGGAKKNSKSNLHKYANLLAVYEAVEEALHQHNIFIWHFAERLADGESVLHTRLIHAPSGQFIQDTRSLKSEKPGNQAVGSANTYMRRYAVLSLCALETEDDDGEDERKYIEKREREFIDPEQVIELQELMKQIGVKNETYQYILNRNGVSDLAELRKSQYNGVMHFIRSLKKTQANATDHNSQ
jgi:hypothetical protein